MDASAYVARYSSCMNDDWFYRLVDALVDYKAKTGLSDRQISMRAGLPREGAVNDILKAHKQPDISRVIAICNFIQVSVTYILLGVEIEQKAEEMALLLEKLPSGFQDHIYGLLQAAQPNGDTREE